MIPGRRTNKNLCGKTKRGWRKAKRFARACYYFSVFLLACGSIFIVWSHCMCNYVDVKTQILKIGLALQSRHQGKKTHRVVSSMEISNMLCMKLSLPRNKGHERNENCCECVEKSFARCHMECIKREKMFNFHATVHNNCTINSSASETLR